VPETVTVKSPVPDPVPETLTAKHPVPDPVPETVAAKRPVPDPVPETVAAKRPDPAPAPARSSGTAGGWVVNLVSYTRQKSADRYVRELKRLGITAERVVAQVNGRTMHRVRITGFETRATASARAGVLKQELELPSIWVAKR
jgi:DedD protein